MNARKITVDFGKKSGKIKPIHATNTGPRRGGVTLVSDSSGEYIEIGVPAVRLHDCEYPYGKNQFVDIHCIFPNPDADADLPESYNFAPTDTYIRSVKEVGADVLLRLGESCDLFPKTLYTKAPQDIEKYASICEHVIMHYNEGWADGFKLNLRRVEISGGADDPRVFSGTREEFFALYRAVACRLREHFPRLKIGGYGAVGFYAVNRLSSTECQKRAIPFLRDFLRYITAEQTAAPLDFFTWYDYPATPEELMLHARYARGVLDEFGLKKTASVICGYNTSSYLAEGVCDRPSYLSELASLLTALQKSDIESAFFSDPPLSESYGRSFILGGTRSEFCPVYHALLTFGELYRLSASVETVGDSRGEIYTLAARSEESGKVMIVTRAYSGNVELRALGIEARCATIRRIASSDGYSSSVSSVCGELAVKDGSVAFRADKDAVYMLEFLR